MSEEMDFAQLVAQEDEIKILTAKWAELEAELSTWVQAVGIVSTLKPDMVIDVSDPVGMMQKVVGHVVGLKAENKRLREALEARRDWFAMQLKDTSNGNLSEWDRHTLQIELDATNAALTTTKGS